MLDMRYLLLILTFIIGSFGASSLHASEMGIAVVVNDDQLYGVFKFDKCIAQTIDQARQHFMPIKSGHNDAGMNARL